VSTEMVKNIAVKLQERGLKEPASLLFESHIPAFTVLYSIFLCTEPFILPFVSSGFRSALHALYEHPELRGQLVEELRKEAV
jgi:hypothetical protein